MLFLAPIAGTVCSAVGGTLVKVLLVGGVCAAGGAVGGALAVRSALGTAGKALTLGAKAFTLANTAKYAGAAYIGYRIAKRCRRQPANPNRDGQDCSDKPI